LVKALSRHVDKYWRLGQLSLKNALSAQIDQKMIN